MVIAKVDFAIQSAQSALTTRPPNEKDLNDGLNELERIDLQDMPADVREQVAGLKAEIKKELVRVNNDRDFSGQGGLSGLSGPGGR